MRNLELPRELQIALNEKIRQTSVFSQKINKIGIRFKREKFESTSRNSEPEEPQNGVTFLKFLRLVKHARKFHFALLQPTHRNSESSPRIHPNSPPPKLP